MPRSRRSRRCRRPRSAGLGRAAGIAPAYRLVDTCAGEFPAETPYFYCPTARDEAAPPARAAEVIVIGCGPIRIGQGIEFDYSAVHAAWAIREAGLDAVVINNNPETVSTDYDVSDRLYFEPLDTGDVLDVIDHERRGAAGRDPQFGGQTALNLVAPLARRRGADPGHARPLPSPPLRTGGRPGRRPSKWACGCPPGATAHTVDEALAVAAEVGYPVLVRPSYVLGGRGMRIVQNAGELARLFRRLHADLRRHPVLIDRFLDGAVELDVDAVSDGTDTLCIVMEQVEHAGIHSGDSACVYPPHTLGPALIAAAEAATAALAQALGIVGLMNVQYAIYEGTLYLLEVNARASRTVPFASKAAGIPLARLATQDHPGGTAARPAGQPPAPTGWRSKAPSCPSASCPACCPCCAPKCKAPANRWAWLPPSRRPMPRHCGRRASGGRRGPPRPALVRARCGGQRGDQRVGGRRVYGDAGDCRRRAGGRAARSGGLLAGRDGRTPARAAALGGGARHPDHQRSARPGRLCPDAAVQCGPGAVTALMRET